MGILETVLKPAEKVQHEVCIPDHAKAKNSASSKSTKSIKSTKLASKNKPELISDSASFIVQGVYEIKKTMMLTGEVCFGTITKNSAFKYNGGEIPINEILVHGRQVPELKEGQKGTITICPEGYVRVVLNDLLEFG